GKEHAVIELSRELARRLRAVLRRSLLADNPRGPWPAVQCRADGTGLTVEACQGEVAVRYHQPGPRPADALTLPGTLLAEIEAPSEVPVTVEVSDTGQGQVRWTERGVPCVVPFEAVPPDQVPVFPELPESLQPQPPELLRALAAAAALAPRESVRYAL